MKYKILALLVIATLLGFSKLPETGSLYSDYETSQGSSFAAADWPVVSFYLREDKLYVGFKIQNAAAYNSIDYSIDYLHEGVTQNTHGTIDNSAANPTITREWFILGGCSGLGEVCWYYEDVHQVDLSVTLHKSGGGTEVINKSLTL